MSTSTNGDRLPAIYLPHGGGPWNLMTDAFGAQADWDRLADWLRGLGQQFRGRVRSLLVISAHWECPVPTVHSGANPGMLYDYYGFPAETYQAVWPAPGDPALAHRVAGLLDGAGIASGRESTRGYDHGCFVPLMVAFPDAGLPVAQLSLVKGLDPAAHLRLGAALRPLRDEGVLIIGSGMSYHNMRGFGDPASRPVSAAFDRWLRDTVELPDAAERERRLIGWEAAPHARDCHPRSEHLLPLHVVAGAGGGDAGHCLFNGYLMETLVSGFSFGGT
jgi:aromatic ring-opening dioxygenase catalytic subunit (LigB family)